MGYPSLMDCDGDVWLPDRVNPGAYIWERDSDGWFANREALEMVWGPLTEVEGGS